MPNRDESGRDVGYGRSGLGIRDWGLVAPPATTLGAPPSCTIAARVAFGVTVEEIVPELEPRPGAVVLPSWAVDLVAVAPRGAHPSYAHGYYDRDNDFYVAWDAISRDRDTFTRWIEEHVLAAVAA